MATDGLLIPLASRVVRRPVSAAASQSPCPTATTPADNTGSAGLHRQRPQCPGGQHADPGHRDEVGAAEPRRTAPGPQQRGEDQRGQAAGVHPGELIDRRQSGVADPRRVQRGVQGGLNPAEDGIAARPPSPRPAPGPRRDRHCHAVVRTPGSRRPAAAPPRRGSPARCSAGRRSASPTPGTPRRAAPPIRNIVSASVFLRPIRSPKWPNTKPPTGRITNPTANVANASRVPTKLDWCGKNAWLNTRLAAVA